MDYSQKAGDAGGGGAHTHTHPRTHARTHTLFCVAKGKGEDKWKKKKVSKKKLLKVLEGRHQSENATVLAILERLKFEIFSC